MTVGSRAQVWHGTCDRTSGGLTKSDLMMKDGRIISRRKSEAARRNPALMERAMAVKAEAKRMREMGERPRGIIRLR
jgi:hypothetical protein